MVELGYFAMPLHPPGTKPADWIDADLAQVQELDVLGFDEAWYGEHYTNEWEPLSCPEMFIARALGVTKRIRLGTGVSSLPYHNPAALAHRIALVDHMAKGRFMWGIGSGALPADGALFNIDLFSLEQRKAAREVLEAVLDLWNDPKPGVYETEFFRYEVPEEDPVTSKRLHMRPYTLPHPPLAVAGVGPKSDMLTLAGQRGWIPLSLNFITPHTMRSQWEVYAENALANGHPADRTIWRCTREIAIAKTSKEARKLAIEGSIGRDWGTYLIPLLKRLGQSIILKVDPEMPDEEITLEYCADNLWIVGDPDEVSEKLSNLSDYTGGFGVLLVMMHEWDSDGFWNESMKLLSEQVRPNLKEPPAVEPMPVSSASAS